MKQMPAGRMVLVLLATALSASFNNVCASRLQPVKESLDIPQGYNTQLTKPIPFGYIHHIDAPFRRFGPDQPIHQEGNEKEDFPDYAMMVLSNVTYLGTSAPLYFEGALSPDVAARLRSSSLKGAPISFSFTTYALDTAEHAWFRKFFSESDLHGRVTVASLRDSSDKEDHPIIALTVEPVPGLVQRLSLATNARQPVDQVFWGPMREDAFHQIVMGDVLF
ncbi:hypothetical protein BX666DRAFT_1271020 [Dichotomocladium elegans]|nr:hypothetical protein BX666DRAFT_1271020 [Dichotomocladium elegans]